MDRIRLTRELCADGFSYAELAAMSKDGALQRVRRGAYAEPPGPVEPADRHRALLEATMRQTPTDAVVSHMSAAVLHGLPTWTAQLQRVHLTRDRTGGGKVRHYVHLHAAALTAEDVCHIDGYLVTSLARTVVDLSRALSMTKSVPIGDAALRLGLSGDDLTAVTARCLGWAGITRARRAIAFLDARSESPGESYSRVVMWEIGLPAPVPQFEVRDARGRLVGRADFGWEEMRTLGEFDGKLKYGRLLKPGQTISDVIYDEKRREDALRSFGWEVVRWLWDDLTNPRELKERLEHAFARGRRVS